MKILLVNDYGIPQGGAEIQMFRLRQLLREKGHDARIFTSSVQNGNFINSADYHCLGTVSSFRTLLQTFNPWAYFKLKKVLREFRPDIVHVKIFLTQLSPTIMPLLRDVPSILHVAWYRPICPTGTKLLPDGGICTVRPGISCYRYGCLPMRDWVPLMIQLRLFRQWRSAFNTILANSESVRDTLLLNGIDGVEVLHYGIPGRPVSPSLLLEIPTVVYAGRLVREKGVDILLRAFAKTTERLPSARLLIAGDGPKRNELKLLISDLNIASKTTLCGHLSQTELDNILGRAWVRAVPSVWAEPFGITVVEAMMRGTAVVASDSGGPREIIENGKSGFLVPPGDVDALAGKLLLLLSDRNLSETLGRAGRSISESRFSEELFLGKLLDIYERLLVRAA